jgi:hypothetical protein
MRNLVIATIFAFMTLMVSPTYFVYAQETVEQMAIPAEQTAPVPDIESSSVIAALKKIDEKIPLGMSGWVLMLATFLIELLMRFVPTAQPRSIFLLLALGLNLLASICTKLSSLMDKLGQNIKNKNIGKE